MKWIGGPKGWRALGIATLAAAGAMQALPRLAVFRDCTADTVYLPTIWSTGSMRPARAPAASGQAEARCRNLATDQRPCAETE